MIQRVSRESTRVAAQPPNVLRRPPDTGVSSSDSQACLRYDDQAFLKGSFDSLLAFFADATLGARLGREMGLNLGKTDGGHGGELAEGFRGRVVNFDGPPEICFVLFCHPFYRFWRDG